MDCGLRLRRKRISELHIDQLIIIIIILHKTFCVRDHDRRCSVVLLAYNCVRSVNYTTTRVVPECMNRDLYTFQKAYTLRMGY